MLNSILRFSAFSAALILTYFVCSHAQAEEGLGSYSLERISDFPEKSEYLAKVKMNGEEIFLRDVTRENKAGCEIAINTAGVFSGFKLLDRAPGFCHSTATAVFLPSGNILDIHDSSGTLVMREYKRSGELIFEYTKNLGSEENRIYSYRTFALESGQVYFGTENYSFNTLFLYEKGKVYSLRALKDSELIAVSPWGEAATTHDGLSSLITNIKTGKKRKKIDFIVIDFNRRDAIGKNNIKIKNKKYTLGTCDFPNNTRLKYLRLKQIDSRGNLFGFGTEMDTPEFEPIERKLKFKLNKNEKKNNYCTNIIIEPEGTCGESLQRTITGDYFPNYGSTVPLNMACSVRVSITDSEGRPISGELAVLQPEHYDGYEGPVEAAQRTNETGKVLLGFVFNGNQRKEIIAPYLSEKYRSSSAEMQNYFSVGSSA